MQAIEEFAAAGVEVLVIDSGSHEYEGIGGVQDIAEAGNPRLPNWNKAKGEHKKFMSALLASPMHIILCLRAREKAKPEKQIVDGREKTVYVDMGLQPIAEKNVMFEATISLMLHEQGIRQDVVKCPAALMDIMGRGAGYITMEDGTALRNWVDGAQRLDPAVERSRGLLSLAAEKGMQALQDQWLKLPKAHQKAIGGNKGCPSDLKASAQAYDEASRMLASASDNANAFEGLNAAAKQLPDAPPAPPAPAPATAPAPVQQPQPAPEPDGQPEDDGITF